MKRKLWVLVELRAGCEDHDGASGVWEVAVDADLPMPIAAGAALDTLHAHVGMDPVENFEISVVDPDTKSLIAEPEDYEQGSHEGNDLERIADSLDGLT